MHACLHARPFIISQIKSKQKYIRSEKKEHTYIHTHTHKSQKKFDVNIKKIIKKITVVFVAEFIFKNIQLNFLHVNLYSDERYNNFPFQLFE